jgi:hypothetical protein
MWSWNGHQWLLDSSAGQLMLHLPYRSVAGAHEPFRLSLDLVFLGAGSEFRGLTPERRPRLELRADDFTVPRLHHWEELEGLRISSDGSEVDALWQPGVSLELAGHGSCDDAEWNTPEADMSLLSRDAHQFSVQLTAQFPADPTAAPPRRRRPLTAVSEPPARSSVADRSLAVVADVELATVRVTVPGEVTKPEEWAQTEARTLGLKDWTGVKLMPPPVALKQTSRSLRTWTVILSRNDRRFRPNS